MEKTVEALKSIRDVLTDPDIDNPTDAVSEIVDAALIQYKIDSELTVHHFKTVEMLNALNLTVAPGGRLWSTNKMGPVQPLSWSAEEAIAFVVRRMLDPEVREAIVKECCGT